MTAGTPLASDLAEALRDLVLTVEQQAKLPEGVQIPVAVVSQIDALRAGGAMARAKRALQRYEAQR